VDASRLLILLYEEINAAWTERITQDMSFRVGVNREGKIVNFTPPGSHHRGGTTITFRKVAANGASGSGISGGL